MSAELIPGMVCADCGTLLRTCYNPHYGNPDRPAGELPHPIQLVTDNLAVIYTINGSLPSMVRADLLVPFDGNSECF